MLYDAVEFRILQLCAGDPQASAWAASHRLGHSGRSEGKVLGTEGRATRQWFDMNLAIACTSVLQWIHIDSMNALCFFECLGCSFKRCNLPMVSMATEGHSISLMRLRVTILAIWLKAVRCVHWPKCLACQSRLNGLGPMPDRLPWLFVGPAFEAWLASSGGEWCLQTGEVCKGLQPGTATVQSPLKVGDARRFAGWFPLCQRTPRAVSDPASECKWSRLLPFREPWVWLWWRPFTGAYGHVQFSLAWLQCAGVDSWEANVS